MFSKLEIGCEAVMTLGNWAATDSRLCLYKLSSSISLKNAYCSHGWKYGCTYSELPLTLSSQSSMWECKIVICVLVEWAEEHRNGDGNSEEGMGREQWRGVDHMKSCANVCGHGILISQVQKVTLFTSFLDACLI